MNDVLKEIFKLNPSVKKKLDDPNFSLSSDYEQTLYKLCKFIEDPADNDIGLQEVFKNLNARDISIFLTILYKLAENKKGSFENYKPMFVKNIFDSITIMNQAELTNYLQELGFDLGKNAKVVINVYYKRRSLPEPDLIISNKAYWFKKTIDDYIKEGGLQQFKKGRKITKEI